MTIDYIGRGHIPVTFDHEFAFGELACPSNCGHNNLHSADVRIWNRDEDMNPAPMISFDRATGGTKVTLRDQKENPSPRRHAIEIVFDCEGCGRAAHTLEIIQHKGVTYMGWKKVGA